MNYRKIERRVAFLFPDRRADVDPLILDIEGHTLDRIVIDSHLDDMCAGTWSLSHFALHGMFAITGEPIHYGTDDEMGAEILSQTVEGWRYSFACGMVQFEIVGGGRMEIKEPTVHDLAELNKAYKAKGAREEDFTTDTTKAYLR